MILSEVMNQPARQRDNTFAKKWQDKGTLGGGLFISEEFKQSLGLGNKLVRVTRVICASFSALDFLTLVISG